ncbi:PREDICTED: R-spondin-2-like isoform X2 [Branchiostoma belcheri]|uniref:R-spondin-2-like isoform X2 n=1 Tax=Branchiostoma belcheri TaxID=7741 RepID=A0A6P4YHV3_BRABE|nr:PREDICTED: R-spondin-2-like isoform X2 [Branchiostoma belcheri]
MPSFGLKLRPWAGNVRVAAVIVCLVLRSVCMGTTSNVLTFDSEPSAAVKAIGLYPVCPRGCTSCSTINGCITCRPRYFLFLYRSGMRQTGLCLHTCPHGYYGVRSPDFNKCSRCKVENCEQCYSRSFCTRCKAPFLLYKGQCVSSCPADQPYVANLTRECQYVVDCQVGPWSPWSPCMRNGASCGYKWGDQTRSRQVWQKPSPLGRPCPELVSNTRCLVQPRFCPVVGPDGLVIDNHSELAAQIKRERRRRKRERRRKKRRKARKRERKENRSRLGQIVVHDPPVEPSAS